MLRNRPGNHSAAITARLGFEDSSWGRAYRAKHTSVRVYASDWRAEPQRDDKRWAYSEPAASNAHFAWWRAG